MKRILLRSCVVGALLLAPPVFAADGSISILSPKDGATVMGSAQNALEFNLKQSPQGHHLHVYVDDNKPIIVRQVTGCPCKVELPALSPGQHTVVVKEATAGHAPTGVEATVHFTAK